MKKSLSRIFISALFLLSILLACTNNQPKQSVDSLELSIRNILEMPACEQIYRDIVYIGEEERMLFIKTTDKKVLFSIDIRIQAGIKNAGMIDIHITDHNEDGTRNASVTLPASEILLADADENTIEQYFIKEWGGEISRLEYYDEINRKKENLIRTAIDSGLLEKADSNTRNLISSFLALSGINVIEYKEADDEI